MKTEERTIRAGVITLMILAATFSRLIPHPFNFAPIGAVAIFGAAYFSNRIAAFLVPMLAMWLSDVVMNNTLYANYYHHNFWLYPTAFPWNYVVFPLIALVGILLLKKVKLTNVVMAALSASVIFFVVTNFGCWLGNPVYTQNITGLLASYTAGLPFFGSTVAGDLFYTGVLFGVFELAKSKFPKLALA